MEFVKIVESALFENEINESIKLGTIRPAQRKAEYEEQTKKQAEENRLAYQQKLADQEAKAKQATRDYYTKLTNNRISFDQRFNTSDVITVECYHQHLGDFDGVVIDALLEKLKNMGVTISDDVSSFEEIIAIAKRSNLPAELQLSQCGKALTLDIGGTSEYDYDDGPSFNAEQWKFADKFIDELFTFNDPAVNAIFMRDMVTMLQHTIEEHSQN